MIPPVTHNPVQRPPGLPSSPTMYRADDVFARTNVGYFDTGNGFALTVGPTNFYYLKLKPVWFEDKQWIAAAQASRIYTPEAADAGSAALHDGFKAASDGQVPFTVSVPNFATNVLIQASGYLSAGAATSTYTNVISPQYTVDGIYRLFNSGGVVQTSTNTTLTTNAWTLVNWQCAFPLTNATKTVTIYLNAASNSPAVNRSFKPPLRIIAE
jgi:hypothetical protein